MKPVLSDYRLYFVTDSRLHKGYPVLEQVKLALEGGTRIIQLREKGLSHKDFVREARKALKMTRSYDAFLIINDAVEVVREVGADGLHLGQEDMPLSTARRLLGNDLIIGVSVKTADQAIRAGLNGADYVAVNGVFPTSTKDDLGYLPGLAGVAEIRRSTNLPVIGIGGINLSNCRSVIEAGAHGVAVVTAVTMSENIPGTCRTFLELIGTC